MLQGPGGIQSSLTGHRIAQLRYFPLTDDGRHSTPETPYTIFQFTVFFDFEYGVLPIYAFLPTPVLISF